MEFDVGSGSTPNIGDSGVSGPSSPNKDDSAIEAFSKKTSAQLVTAEQFRSMKEQLGLHVVGVTGFSGQWSQERIDADPSLREVVNRANLLLTLKLIELSIRYGDRLIVSSGATMEGVPKLVYEACESLDISAMGVTSEKAADYELGKMDYLIVEGKDWGDESKTFIDSSDEILMVGGGGQAKREAIAASTEGKPVTIFQGFGGSADQLAKTDLPDADFIARH